jgi:hypothetical protein
VRGGGHRKVYITGISSSWGVILLRYCRSRPERIEISGIDISIFYFPEWASHRFYGFFLSIEKTTRNVGNQGKQTNANTLFCNSRFSLHKEDPWKGATGVTHHLPWSHRATDGEDGPRYSSA